MCEVGNPRRRWLVPFFVSLIFTSGIEEIAEAIRELQGCIAKHETPVITSVVPFQYSTNFKGPSAQTEQRSRFAPCTSALVRAAGLKSASGDVVYILSQGSHPASIEK